MTDVLPISWEVGSFRTIGGNMVLNIKRITRVLTDQNDTVYMEVEASTPYPELDAKEPGRYPASVQMNVRYGYGEEWIRKSFGEKVEYEFIDGRHPRRSDFAGDR